MILVGTNQKSCIEAFGYSFGVAERGSMLQQTVPTREPMLASHQSVKNENLSTVRADHLAPSDRLALGGSLPGPVLVLAEDRSTHRNGVH